MQCAASPVSSNLHDHKMSLAFPLEECYEFKAMLGSFALWHVNSTSAGCVNGRRCLHLLHAHQAVRMFMKAHIPSRQCCQPCYSCHMHTPQAFYVGVQAVGGCRKRRSRGTSCWWGCTQMRMCQRGGGPICPSWTCMSAASRCWPASMLMKPS